MPAIKFTDAYVRNLKPKASRYEVCEDRGHGNGRLAVRVSANGHKAWQFLYTFEGRDRRMTLGSYPEMSVADAHAACAAAALSKAHGGDPGASAVTQKQEERKAPTVNQLAEQYIELYAKPRKRSWKGDETLLKRNVLPHLGAQKAAAVTRGDIAKLLDGIIARGAPIPANRTRAVLSKMFRWAVSRDMVPANPLAGLPPPSVEHKRDRRLADDEVAAVLSRLDTAKMQPAARLAIRFQFYTAARIGEACGAEWSEIDEAAATWTIPAERSKNKRAHRLPLSAQALAVLREAKGLPFPVKASDDPAQRPAVVFPALQHGRSVDPTKVAGDVRENLAHFGVAPFTPHDVRRTVATGLGDAGTRWEVVQRVLNHIDSSVTATYNRAEYTKEMREALDAWGRKVAGLVARTRFAVVENA